MRKSIITTVLIALFALMGSVGSASAAYSGVSVIVSPGSRVCTNPVYGSYKVRADGQAASPGVRWTLNRSANGVSYTEIYQSPSDYTTAFAAEYSLSFYPSSSPDTSSCARGMPVPRESMLTFP